MLLYAFICFSYAFHMISYAFHTLLYTFIRFWYAFIRIQTQKSKTSPPPPPPPPPTLTVDSAAARLVKSLLTHSHPLDHIFCFVHLLFRRTRSARRVLCQSWSPGEGWLCHSQTEPPILQNFQRILSSHVRDTHKGQRATFFRLLVRDSRFQARPEIGILQVIFFALK